MKIRQKEENARARARSRGYPRIKALRAATSKRKLCNFIKVPPRTPCRVVTVNRAEVIARESEKRKNEEETEKQEGGQAEKGREEGIRARVHSRR